MQDHQPLSLVLVLYVFLRIWNTFVFVSAVLITFRIETNPFDQLAHDLMRFWTERRKQDRPERMQGLE